MEKHSLWGTLLTVLANLVSKFVTDSRIIIRDSATGGYLKVTVSAPFQIDSADVNEDGNIVIKVGKGKEDE